MQNHTVGLRGQKIAELAFKKLGYEIDRVYLRNNFLPYDIAIKKPEHKTWTKVQVKATRSERDSKLVFRTQKKSSGKKIMYGLSDLDIFAFVDLATKTIVTSRYLVMKTQFTFSSSEWKKIAK